jgi:hypothetical protein
MSIITKRGKWIILIILIALILSSVYILKSGSKKFALLNIDNLSSLSSLGLKLAVEATEECNELEAKYKQSCYIGIAWESGYYYENTVCENLDQEFKHFCYQGYGENLGERYDPDIKIIQDKCSKTDFYEECFSLASRGIGSESSKYIETEKCQGFEQEDIKQRCYEGIGRQLATDNKEQILCGKVKNEEACLLGFAHILDNKGNRKEALQICLNLSETILIKKCYTYIGINNQVFYNPTIKESFKDCEKYAYAEECKQGAASGIAYKFFLENQKKNSETDSVTTPVIPQIYKITNRPAAKISLSIKQQIIPHFINYKLIYLTIILSASGIIIIIRVLNNKKVQKVIKKTYEKTRKVIQEIYYISTKELLMIYKKFKLIIRDILSIDKTTITSFSKELKTELGSKEGKKKL